MCVRKNFGSVAFIGITRSSFLRIQNFYVYGNRAPVMRGSGEEAPGKRSGTGGGSIQWVVAPSVVPEGTPVSSSGLDMSVQSWSLSNSGREETPGADQARRLTSSTEADWGGRSLGGPGGAGSAALRRWTPV